MKKIIAFIMAFAVIINMIPGVTADAVENYTLEYDVTGGTAVVSGIAVADYSDVVVPSSVFIGGKDYTVTGIGEEAFRDCKNILSVKLPETLTEIGIRAFYGCERLTSIIIPQNVTAIGHRAFAGCISIKSIKILGNIQSLGQYTFSDCHKLQELVLPDSCTSIVYGAFKNCVSLERVVINSPTFTINNESVENYTKMQPDYTVENDIPEIKGNNSTTPNVGMGNKVKGFTKYFVQNQTVADHLIENGVPAENINVGSDYGITDGLEDEIYSFKGVRTKDGNTAEITGFAQGKKPNVSLTLNIPEQVTANGVTYTVTSIGDEAFYEVGPFSVTYRITGINFPSTIDKIGENAFQETEIKSLTIPGNIRVLERGAFKGCKNLVDVKIEEGVKAITDQTFYNAGIKSIVLPKSSIYLNIWAFQSCSKLNSIVIGGEDVSFEGQAAGLGNLRKVYVRNETVKNKIQNLIITETNENQIEFNEINNMLVLIGGYNYNIPTVVNVSDSYQLPLWTRDLFTHTGWTDGTAQYNIGQAVTPDGLMVLKANWTFDNSSTTKVTEEIVEENIIDSNYLESVMKKDERSISDTVNDADKTMTVKVDENIALKAIDSRQLGVTWCGEIQADAFIDKNTGELAEEVESVLPNLPNIKVYRGDVEPFVGLFDDYSIYTNDETMDSAKLALKRGVNSILKLNLLINPDAEFIFILPVFTAENETVEMSPEACVNFHKFLTAESGDWADLRKEFDLDPINVIAYELGNETYHQCRSLGTTEQDIEKIRISSEAYIKEAIRYYNTLKPHTGNIEYAASLVAESEGWQDYWNTYIIRGLDEYVKGLYSLHTYYGKANSPKTMIDEMCDHITKIYRDEIGYSRNIRFAHTEHAVWGNDYNRTSLFAGIAEVAFYNNILTRDDTWCATYHTFYGGGNKYWSMLSDVGGLWVDSAPSKATKLMWDNIGDRLIDIKYKTADNTYSSQTQNCKATVSATAKGNDTLILTIANTTLDKGSANLLFPVDINFEFNNNYTLQSVKTYSAPNMFSAAVNAGTRDIIEVEETTPNTSNFTRYTIPANSVSVLVLKTTGKISEDIQIPADRKIITGTFVDVTEGLTDNDSGEYTLNIPSKFNCIRYSGSNTGFKVKGLNMFNRWETVADYKMLVDGKVFIDYTEIYYKKIKLENCIISEIDILSTLDEDITNTVFTAKDSIKIFNAQNGIFDENPTVTVLGENMQADENGILKVINRGEETITVGGKNYVLNAKGDDQHAQSYYIDFENSEIGTQSGANTVFENENWISNSNANFEFGIMNVSEDESDGKHMAISSFGEDDVLSYPAVYYNKSSDMSNIGGISFDLTRNTGDVKFGIRFMVSEDLRSFYQLEIQKYSDLRNNKLWILSKVTDGVQTKLKSGIYHIHPSVNNCHYDLYYDNYGIYWNANFIDSGRRYEELSGEYLFDSPITCENSKFGFFAYRNNHESSKDYYAYVDNVEFYDLNSKIFDYTVTEGKITINGFDSGCLYADSLEELFIPDSIDGIPVTVIGDEAFKGKNFKKVTLSDGLEKIGTRAFANCSKLLSINIPSTVTEWSKSLENCEKLREVKIADGVQTIPDAFYNCNSLNFMIIPKSVTNVDFLAFGIPRLRLVIFEGSNFKFSNTASCGKLGERLYGDVVFYAVDSEGYAKLQDFADRKIKEDKEQYIRVKQVVGDACIAFFQRSKPSIAGDNHYKSIFVYAVKDSDGKPKDISGKYIMSIYDGETFKYVKEIGDVSLNGADYMLMDVSSMDIDTGEATNSLGLMLVRDIDGFSPIAEKYLEKPW